MPSPDVYLLDENVLRELHPSGQANVRAWFAGIPDAQLRISVMTLFEKRRGWERRLKADPALAKISLQALDAFEATYSGRVVPIDGPVVAEWTRLLGAKDKNLRDRALAATARVHGFVIATRNIDDFRGCNVRVINPFRAAAVIEIV